MTPRTRSSNASSIIADPTQSLKLRMSLVVISAMLAWVGQCSQMDAFSLATTRSAVFAGAASP
jgi:hypothetical protein